jgi:hypothetical protein
MSKEFERLKALIDLSEPSERDPQVDRDEAAKLAARWGWLARRARGQRVKRPQMPRPSSTSLSGSRALPPPGGCVKPFQVELGWMTLRDL